MAIIKPSLNSPKGAENKKTTVAQPYTTVVSAKKTAATVTAGATKAKPVVDIKQYRGIKGTATAQTGAITKPGQAPSQEQTQKTKLSVYKAEGGFWSKIKSCFGKK